MKKPKLEIQRLNTQDELILSSIVKFYLSGKKEAIVLAMEAFKKEYRQHLEKYTE
jgi:hypothetical protein